MSITLTTEQQNALAAAEPKPRQFVEIVFGANTLRLASGKDITWNGNIYVKSGLSVSDVVTGKGGVQTCRIKLINELYTYSDYAINTGFAYREVKYWKVYGDGPYAVDDPILKFTGEIISIPQMGEEIVLNCATKNAATRMVPFMTLGPPSVKHMPYPGQRLAIGDEVFIVEVD